MTIMKTQEKKETKNFTEKLRFGMSIITKDFSLGREIEGFVSMEMSKRDFDICPPSSFNIAQFMMNGQVWYNHQLWKDENGNEIPIGKVLELYAVRVELIDGGEIGKEYAAVDEDSGQMVGFIGGERANALSIKGGDTGLWTKIRIDEQKVWDMIAEGRLNAFSWQGLVDVAEVWDIDKSRMVRMCQSVDLIEISVVTVGAHEKAIFQVVKSFVGALADEKSKDFNEQGNSTVSHKDKEDQPIEPEKKEENTKKSRVITRGDYFITDKSLDDGHYHVALGELINGMIVGKTVVTAGVDVEDHVHAINSFIENPVTNKSTGSDHFHTFPTRTFKTLSKQAEIRRIVQARKFVLSFADLPVAPKNMKFRFTDEDVKSLLGGNNDEMRLVQAFVWVNEQEPFVDENWNINTKALQLPIAKMVNGTVTAIWEGVAKAMSQLFGADGGVVMSSAEFKAAYEHLRKYYKKFGEEPPELKSYSYKEYRNYLESARVTDADLQFSVLGSRKGWRSNSGEVENAIFSLTSMVVSKSK